MLIFWFLSVTLEPLAASSAARVISHKCLSVPILALSSCSEEVIGSLGWMPHRSAKLADMVLGMAK
jgi:hypothetical protein